MKELIGFYMYSYHIKLDFIFQLLHINGHSVELLMPKFVQAF